METSSNITQKNDQTMKRQHTGPEQGRKPEMYKKLLYTHSRQKCSGDGAERKEKRRGNCEGLWRERSDGKGAKTRKRDRLRLEMKKEDLRITNEMGRG